MSENEQLELQFKKREQSNYEAFLIEAKLNAINKRNYQIKKLIKKYHVCHYVRRSDLAGIENVDITKEYVERFREMILARNAESEKTESEDKFGELKEILKKKINEFIDKLKIEDNE